MIKVLIVEDEAGIRDSLSQAFSWTEIGCELIGSVDSGLAALEFCIHTQPDIIISDIVMPGIDGLTFLKYIKEKYNHVKFIILTGHREFNYAKDAVNLGAEFFMLKPINYNELLSALTTLIDRIINELEKKREETQQVQVIRNLLLGRIYRKNNMIPKVRTMLDNIHEFRIAVIKFDNDIDNDPFKAQTLLTFCENANIVSDLIIKTDDFHLALFLPTHDEEDFSELYQHLSQIKNKISDFFQTTVSIGISSILYGDSSLHEAYLESLRALGKKFFSGNNSINVFLAEDNLNDKNKFTDYNYLSSISDRAKEILALYKEEELVHQCKILFEQFIHACNQNVDFVKSSFLIMVSTLIRKILGEQNKRYIFFYEKHSNFQNIIRCELLDDLEELFIDIMIDLNNYVDSKNGSHQNLISKVQQYIQQHYSENITLNDIAKVVFLSPAYLSSLITSETGKSFVDMLNELRVSQAIELLKNPKSKISEIAYSVGFNEPQYFTLTFKKYTGHTPRNYRELYLQNN